MSRRLALAAALALVGATLVAFAPVADAVGAPTSGWWSRLATTTPTDEVPAALPVPAPAAPDTIPAGATVPQGQLLVEGTPEGAIAVAAARWELAGGESSPSLVLPIGPGSSVNPQSVVLACKAAAPWAPPAEGSAGTWDGKPLVDGSRCVNGVIADDLSTISFGVQPLVSGSVLDVVLVPGRDPVEVPPGVPEPPADLDGSAFRWLLDPPTVESLDVVAGSDFSEGEGNRFVTPPAGNAPDLGPAPPPSDTVFGTVPSPATGPPLDAAAPALEPQDLAPSVPDLTRALPASTTPEPVNRTLGFVLLALAGLVAAWAYLTSNGVGPGAVAAGDVVVGGLSRFARPRVTPPTRLS